MLAINNIFNYFSGEYWNDEQSTGFLELGKPDDIDISLEMKDWLFALEGLREAAEEPLTFKYNGIKREERHWHGTFQSIRIYAKSSSNTSGTLCRSNKYPLESLVVSFSFYVLSVLAISLSLFKSLNKSYYKKLFHVN